jgi:hypothetical protein
MGELGIISVYRVALQSHLKRKLMGLIIPDRHLQMRE